MLPKSLEVFCNYALLFLAREWGFFSERLLAGSKRLKKEKSKKRKTREHELSLRIFLF